MTVLVDLKAAFSFHHVHMIVVNPVTEHVNSNFRLRVGLDIHGEQSSL